MPKVLYGNILSRRLLRTAIANHYQSAEALQPAVKSLNTLLGLDASSIFGLHLFDN